MTEAANCGRCRHWTEMAGKKYGECSLDHGESLQHLIFVHSNLYGGVDISLAESPPRLYPNRGFTCIRWESSEPETQIGENDGT